MEGGRRIHLSWESEVLWLQVRPTHTSTPRGCKVWDAPVLSGCGLHILYSNGSPVMRNRVPKTQQNEPLQARERAEHNVQGRSCSDMRSAVSKRALMCARGAVAVARTTQL